jgi:hypothetical protein
VSSHRIDTHRISIDVTVRVSDERIEVEGVRAHRRIEGDFNRLCQEQFQWVIERTEARSGKGRFESFAGDWNGLVTTVRSCEGGDDDFEKSVDTLVFRAEVEGERAVVTTNEPSYAYTSPWAVRNTPLGIDYEDALGDDAEIVEEVR